MLLLTAILVVLSNCSVMPMRYIQWTHSTPTMILVMSMLGDLSTRELAQALLADFVMIFTGLGASVTTGPTQGRRLGVVQ